MNVEGLRVLPSRHGPAETLERLEAAVLRNGLKIVARIDHGAAAKVAGVELRPTVLVMFGSAGAGAPTIKRAPTLAIDLPLKVLVWEDENGATRAAYNDAAWLSHRHGLADQAMVDVLDEVMANVVGEAVA
ncbi:MAG: DUF302 domain-containing protein [Alphaproteobacteria bacterium]|nr:DUF302 domain-containing protein [Alphaproteobacteria bacterium]MBV8413022.1 DUF302 domain-containing protein [Alphaproteobacteria bacterium]